jgi:alpha-tubulin suppressor-like RCC1 family protein
LIDWIKVFGDVYMFGANDNGSLGVGSTEPIIPEPMLVQGLDGISVVNVTTAYNSTALIDGLMIHFALLFSSHSF